MALKHPIGYLERTDFTESGNLQGGLNNKPVLIMIQSESCGHCQTAKPAFQSLGDEGIVSCMTIQPDGERQSERDIKPILNNIYPNFRGFPSYILYVKGQRIPYEGGRSASELREFVLQHI